MKKTSKLKTWALMVAALPSAVFAQTVNVDLGNERQLIRGFGGINFPGWINDLNESERATAFGNGENQLGLSILRIHVDPNESAWRNEIATAQYAVKQGCYVFASPWSPPSNMTESYKGSKKLKMSSYGDYVTHLNKFIRYMKDNGVDLYAMSIQNEPDYGSDWTWWDNNNMGDMIKFLKENAPNINCRVMAPEAFQYSRRTTDPIINDKQAWANVDILATHLYGTQVSQFNYPLYNSNSAGKELWMTEVYYPNSDGDADNWPEALEVADHISNAMVVGNFQTYVWWYIRRSYSFIKDNGKITKRGACMAQFSKFIRPGYVRVDATQHPGNDNNLNVSAYKKENDVVIVAVNRNTSSKTLNISIPNSQVTEWERYVTDQTRNFKKESNVNGATTFSLTLDARSAVTLVGKGKSGTPKVTIVSPTVTDDVETGANIDFVVEATDEDGSIQTVKFYNGTTLLGEVNSAPYKFTINDLPEGTVTLKAVATDNEGNDGSASVTIKVHVPQTPYGGTAQTIPGKIEAENFDLGGEGVAYSDSEEENKGGEYREKDGVDITSIIDGGYAIGYTNAGEWLEYTVDVKKSDAYVWSARVSSGSTTSSFSVELDGKKIIPTVNVENTGDWETYKVINGDELNLEAGEHTLRIVIDGSYVNIDWIEFALKNATGVELIKASHGIAPDTYEVFDLNGKKLGIVTIKAGDSVKDLLKKVNLQSGVFILNSKSESFKIEIDE